MTTVVEETRRERNETDLERSDRNLIELLQEVRVIQTGVQVLFAFLLTAPLMPRFAELEGMQHGEYFFTLVFSGAAVVLLVAPTAWHRVLFRCGDKEHLVTVANRLTIGGLVCLGLAMVGAMAFVTDVLYGGRVVVPIAAGSALGCLVLWAVLPLRRRMRIRRSN